jgi:pimeloyl-ACP methyl ester carboxylesterase
MKKKPCFTLNMLFLFVMLCSKVPGQTPSAAIRDSIDQMNFFHETKREFANYEQVHGRTLKTNNVKMHYLVWGKPGNTVLVWLHGTYSNSYELTEIVDSLVKENLYVIAIDYYGHGFTPIPEKEVSLYHIADDIRFLLDTLHIQKAVIGGWSRGGSIATAFYDAYPSYVSGLILDDGGSVAWSINDHKKEVDTLIKEINDSYKNRPPKRYFNSQSEAYYSLYLDYLRGRSKPGLRKEIFTYLARLKQDSTGKWGSDPGVADLICLRTADQVLLLKHRYLQATNLFGISTELIYPKIIYRNLDVPMLIFDPISKDDWFDFEEENRKLQLAHPAFITHKIYTDTDHNTRNKNPGRYAGDINAFIKTVIRFHHAD